MTDKLTNNQFSNVFSFNLHKINNTITQGSRRYTYLRNVTQSLRWPEAIF